MIPQQVSASQWLYHCTGGPLALVRANNSSRVYMCIVCTTQVTADAAAANCAHCQSHSSLLRQQCTFLHMSSAFLYVSLLGSCTTHRHWLCQHESTLSTPDMHCCGCKGPTYVSAGAACPCCGTRAALRSFAVNQACVSCFTV